MYCCICDVYCDSVNCIALPVVSRKRSAICICCPTLISLMLSYITFAFDNEGSSL